FRNPMLCPFELRAHRLISLYWWESARQHHCAITAETQICTPWSGKHRRINGLLGHKLDVSCAGPAKLAYRQPQQTTARAAMIGGNSKLRNYPGTRCQTPIRSSTSLS